MLYFYYLGINSESIVSNALVKTKILIHVHFHIHCALCIYDAVYLTSIRFVPGESWCRNSIGHTLQRHCLTNPRLGNWYRGFFYCGRVWKIKITFNIHENQWVEFHGNRKQVFHSCGTENMFLIVVEVMNFSQSITCEICTRTSHWTMGKMMQLGFYDIIFCQVLFRQLKVETVALLRNRETIIAVLTIN